MQPNSYSWLKANKEQLSVLIGRQLQISRKINFDHKGTDKLSELSDRLKNEDFKVMVMGMFNSGKSTFINSLLGKRILPAKMMPSTAIICEIKYAEQQKCVLHPKKDLYKDQRSGKIINEPFEVPIDELKNYIVIKHDLGDPGDNDNSEDSSVNKSPFEKLVLYWPLGICRDGVEIIDSPGLNDPNSHDIITLEYLPNTDAIIYCMNSATAYTKKDKSTIEELVHMGYKSIIFIITNFDRIQESGEEEEFVQLMTNELKKHTSLGAEGVLFVNSLGGAIGKEEHNEEKLKKSFIPLVELKVENHLVNQKGKARLILAENQVKNQNELTGRYADNKIKLNSLGLEELQKKHEHLSLILNSAKNKRDLMLKTLALGISDILNRATNLGRAYLRTLDAKIEQWVTEHTPETSISFYPWKIKSSVKANVDEYIAHIKYKMKQESLLWGNEVLYPMIAKTIRQISADTDELQKSYENLLRDYQIEIDINVAGGNAQEEIEPTVFAQIGALLYGAVSGDFIGAGMGFTFGFKGLLSSLAAQVAAGVILGIASFFTPIGLPAIIIAAIIAGIATGTWNFQILPGKIKKTIIHNTQKALSDPEAQDKMLNSIKANIKSELDKLVKEAEELFDKDITPKEAAMKEAIAIREKGEHELKAESELLANAKRDNERLKKDLESFSMTLHL